MYAMVESTEDDSSTQNLFSFALSKWTPLSEPVWALGAARGQSALLLFHVHALHTMSGPNGLTSPTHASV